VQIQIKTNISPLLIKNTKHRIIAWNLYRYDANDFTTGFKTGLDSFSYYKRDFYKGTQTQ